MINRILLLVLILVSVALAGHADTAIGDWGHFVLNHPRVLLNNPDGQAFTVTIHVMRWPKTEWNKPTTPARIIAPDGRVIWDGEQALTNAMATLDVPAGVKGVYRLETDGQPHWISSTLDEAVLWTGDPAKDHVFRERFAPAFQCVVPRTWWFYVPSGVTRFTVNAQRSSEYMSQREDWGMFVITPRGQRIRALWGQPPITPPLHYRQDMVAEVEVEPGAGGRFWALEIGYGDSHNYSKPNVCLDGVPPYLARSPEEWFDPATGCKPPFNVYDDDPFIQSARDEAVMNERWPNLQHFSPCPSLGDPDGVEVLGDATFELWNPDGRDLRFRIGAYLPRRGAEDPARAQVIVTGPKGNTVFDAALPLLHIHGDGGQPTNTLSTGPGISAVSVTGADRWLAFTYPATPLVLLGADDGEGWSTFRFTAATARNWYFYVPPGTKAFSVRVTTAALADVVNLAVNAPDRTMAVIYDHAGERTIAVPAGLDGKIWHLRPSTASAARLLPPTAVDRYQDLELTVALRGVPGRLAPTWEQWFASARAERRETLSYKTVGGTNLDLNVFTPTVPLAGPRPAILLIHGGGWRAGQPSLLTPVAQYFAAHGLVAVTVAYRLVDKSHAVTLEDCLTDCRDALAFMRRSATKLGIDPARIAVAGESAGGHLAAMLALEQQAPAALLLYNPVLDLTALSWVPLPRTLAGETGNDLAQRLSPLHHVKPGWPPTLLIHGAADPVVPVEQADQFATAMQAAGNRIVYHRQPEWKHAFLIADYGTDVQIAAALELSSAFFVDLGWYTL